MLEAKRRMEEAKAEALFSGRFQGVSEEEEAGLKSESQANQNPALAEAREDANYYQYSIWLQCGPGEKNSGKLKGSSKLGNSIHVTI